MSLPASWKEVNLIDVCQVNPRPPVAADITPETPVSVPIYNGGDVLTGPWLEYEQRSFGQTKGLLFKNGDVLVGTRGSSAVKSQLVELLPPQIGVAQHYLVLRARPELRPEYLLYFVQQPWFQMAARNSNRGTQSQLTIPIQFFRDLRLPLPPLEEQDVLIQLFKNASLAPYREALSHARRLLDVLAQNLLVSGDRATTYQTFRLNEVCSLIPPRVRSKDNTAHSAVNYYSQTNVNWLTHQIEPEQTVVENLTQYCGEVHPGELLFNLGREAYSRSTVCLVPSNDNVRHFASAAFQVIRPTNGILPQYLAWFMRLPWVRDQVRAMSQPRTHVRLSRTLLDRVEIPLPSLDRQIEIVKLLDNVPTLHIHHALEIATLLAQALYRDGFAGQLSKPWREAFAEVSALAISVQAHIPSVEIAPQLQPSILEAAQLELYAPTARRARLSVASQLSAVQMHVWERMCDKRHPLLIDAPDDVDAFCLALQLDTDMDVAPIALRHALRQLAALGLIRQMSIPGEQGTFVTAFRRYRVTELGRAAEDTTESDIQLLRKKIADLSGS